MSFTSFEFVFFIIPILVVYYLIPSAFWKKCILLGASISFYLSFDVTSFFYLASLILYVYVASFLIESRRTKGLTLLLVIPILLGLGYFKYYDFILKSFQSFLVIERMRFQLAVPLGISFFTFKSVGYLLDVAHGKQDAELSLLNVALYLSFFPQISSGPIQKSGHFISQISKNHKFKPALTQHGTMLVLFGVFEKMVISDRLYVLVNHCFKDLSLLTPSMAVIGAVGYAFQIYSDFDSYSNIAIGLTEIFGYTCPKNFNTPYLSRNMNEFWKRWHISLSNWLKEYVYIPLGGNRKGVFRKYLNLLIVFAISGLWHGAAWNFVLWGILNGVIQIVYDLSIGQILSRCTIKNKVVRFAGSMIGIVINFCVVVILWVLFRFQTLEEIQIVLKTMAQLELQSFSAIIEGIELSEMMATFMFVLMLIVTDVLRYLGFTMHHFRKIPFVLRMIVYFVMLIMFVIFAVYGPGYDPAKFIYLEF